MKKLKYAFWLIFFLTSCNSEQLPAYLEDFDNLRVFPGDTVPPYTISLVRDLQFGQNDEILFNRMGIVEVDDQNHVYISEEGIGGRTIHQFTADGTYLVSISNEGDGPGEFRTLQSIQYMRGYLYLNDRFHRRVLIYGQEYEGYEYKGHVSLGSDLSSLVDPDIIRLPEEVFVISDGSLIVGFEEPQRPNIDTRETHYYRVDKGGYLKSEKLFKQRAVSIFQPPLEDVTIQMILPFGPKPLIEVTKDGMIYKAWSEIFLIEVLDFEGNTLSTIYYPFSAQPLNRSEHIREYESNRDFHRAIQQADFPTNWPALDNLLVDDENRLWVSTIVEDFDVYEWWILEETGELVTKFEWPRNESIEVVKNDYMYTRETDEETGLQQVVRYRIEMEEAML